MRAALAAIAAGTCVVAAAALVGSFACARAATGYEGRVELQLVRAYEGRCDAPAGTPSLAARVGLRLRGDPAAADRLVLASRLLRLVHARSCGLTSRLTSESKDDGPPDLRVPYHRLLGQTRALAVRDHGTGRADTLGLLGLTLVRASEVDLVNATAFVAEAETASRQAVRLKPADSLLQTNLEVVLRLRQRDEQDQRREGKRAQQQKQVARKASQQPIRSAKHRPLPGPGRDAAGGY